mgnify:CR=1 FL=1
MVFFSEVSADMTIGSNRLSELIDNMLKKLGNLSRVLILPSDFTRYHSYAGEITSMLYGKLKNSSYIEIMPDGEEIFYVSNPAQDLWAGINRFKQND